MNTQGAVIESGSAAQEGIGSCHGFHVRSELPLRLLRESFSGPTAEPLTVLPSEDQPREPAGPPIQVWVPTREKPFSARLYATGDGFEMWVDGVGAYRVNTERCEIRVPSAASTALVETRLWGLPSVLCFLSSGDVSLHAAAIDIDGRAVLLTAPGRSGKTTLAAAFHRAGYRVVSEDLCRIRTNPEPLVFPGAAMLRLRHDVRAGLGVLPSTEVVLENEDRVHLAMTGSHRGDGGPLPLAGIVTLNAGSGPAALERVDPVQAIRDLWVMSFNVPTDTDRARCFGGVSELVASVPVWNLRRELTLDTLPAVVDRIATTCVP